MIPILRYSMVFLSLFFIKPRFLESLCPKEVITKWDLGIVYGFFPFILLCPAFMFHRTLSYPDNLWFLPCDAITLGFRVGISFREWRVVSVTFTTFNLLCGCFLVPLLFAKDIYYIVLNICDKAIHVNIF